MPKTAKKFKITPELRSEIEKLIEERVTTVQISVGDLNELKQIVKLLAEAQIKTEERLHILTQRIDDLTQKVSQLAEAQIKTEERLNILTQRVDQLTERVDDLTQRLNQLTQRVDSLTQRVDDLTQRLNQLTQRVDSLTQRVDELAQGLSQLTKRVDQLTERVDDLTQRLNQLTQRVDSLTQRVDELAQGLSQLTKRVDQLAERVDGLTQSMKELADAQKKTELAIVELSSEFEKMRKLFGNLSDAIGYGLEDRAIKSLPKLLERDHNIKVEGELRRLFLKTDEGWYTEVNIFGFGIKDNKRIAIIGEGKSQLSKNGVDEFIKKKLQKLTKTYPDMFPVMVTYMVAEPDVEEYAKSNGIVIYFSYNFD